MIFKYGVGMRVVVQADGVATIAEITDVDTEDLCTPYRLQWADGDSDWYSEDVIICREHEYDGQSLDDEDYDWEVEEVTVMTLPELLEGMLEEAVASRDVAEEEMARATDLINDLKTALRALQG